MTREEAEARARRLAAEDESHSFFARERGGDWQVAKVPAVGRRVKPTGTAIEERSRPEADDPRSSLDRNVPGYQG